MRNVSTSVRVTCAALADAVPCGSRRPAKGPEVSVKGGAGGGDGVASSMRRVMADRCTPASTATREPLRQSCSIERTRNAVTLDSCGPPPEP